MGGGGYALGTLGSGAGLDGWAGTKTTGAINITDSRRNEMLNASSTGELQGKVRSNPNENH